MLSVVVVYNDERALNEILLESLSNQTTRFELITIDNTDGQFKSAAAALNYGGAEAKGDYIMFAHQDMWLGSNSWLSEVEEILKSTPDLGVAGVAGQSEEGRKWAGTCWRFIDWFRNSPEGREAVEKAEEVQTLDECLLIVPKTVFSKLNFDEKVFDGWDCYGADYCLCVRRLALKAYVIPAPCSHSSKRATYAPWNLKDLLKYQKRLYRKHKSSYRHIYTRTAEVSWLNLRLLELLNLLGPVYLRLFPTSHIILKRELSGCDAVLDLGCGDNSPIQRSDIRFSVGVELFEPYLRESKRRAIHSQYVRADVRKLELKRKSFDAVTAIDLLEHLTKEEGHTLIQKTEMWARKKVIIMTPNGYLRQDTYDSNPLQEHKSGWSAKELRDMGFKVRGINGWKRLRGYKGSIRYKPLLLWRPVSDLTQKITHRWPSQAFQLLAVKEIRLSDKE